MENTSKAIYIAGAVIIALAIVSLGLLIYNIVKNSLGVANVQIDNIVAQEYNAQYLVYDKEFVTGIEVKECIAEVLYNNANATDETVFVTGLTVENKAQTYEYIKIEVDNKGKKKATNNNLSLSNINNASRYTTTIILGNDGLVQNIVFKIKGEL